MKFGLNAFPAEALVKLETWTPEQAALFSLGLAPDGMTTPAHMIKGDFTLGLAPEGTAAHIIKGGDTERFTANVLFRVKLFEAHSREPLPPAGWLTWCRANGHTFDDGLMQVIDALPGVALVKPVARQALWEQQILETLKQLGHDPLRVPPAGGKTGVKAEVRQLLSEANPAMTRGKFDKAWDRLRKDQLIKGG